MRINRLVLATGIAGAVAAATGQIASTVAGANNPQTPTGVSCTYYFWKSLF